MTEGAVEEQEGLLVKELARQTKASALALGESLEGRAAIYMDTRYWIILRDVLRGGYGTSGAKLLERLRVAVRMGHVFCPISESTIFELFKQNDPNSRAETARLVDELSLGVAILGSRERMRTELAHFIRSHAMPLTGEELHPV